MQPLNIQSRSYDNSDSLSEKVIMDLSNEMHFFEFWKNQINKKYPAPYCSYEWYLAALATLEDYSEPYVVTVSKEQHLVGLCPFVTKKKRLYGKKIIEISFINHHYTPFQDVYISEAENEVCDKLVDFFINRRRNVTLNLKEIRHDSPLISTLAKKLGNKGFLYHITPLSNSYQVFLSETFEDLLKRLSSRVRKEFKRKLNRLDKLGRVNLDIVNNYDDVSHNLNLFFSFLARTWKGKEPKPEFYFKLAQAFYSKGSFRLYKLTLNDCPIAFLYSIIAGDTLFAIKTTYDPSYYAFSPGVVLFYKVIEMLHSENSIRILDFGRGEEQFKKEWDPSSSKQFSLKAYPRSPIFALYCFMHHKVRPMIKESRIYEYVLNLKKAKATFFTKFKSKMFFREKRCILIKDIACNNSFQNNEMNNTIRCANNDDILKLAVAMEARNLKVILDRFKNNYICLIDEKDSIIKRYCWLTGDTKDAVQDISISAKILDKINFNIKDSCLFISDHNLNTKEVGLLISEGAPNLAQLKKNKIGILTKSSLSKEWEKFGFRPVCIIMHTCLMGLDFTRQGKI